MLVGAKTYFQMPEGEGVRSGVGGSGEPTSSASASSAEDLAPPSVDPPCEAQTNAAVTAHLTIGSAAREALSEIHPASFSEALQTVRSFTQNTQSLMVAAKKDGQLGYASVQAELVEAIKAAEAVSRRPERQFTDQVLPSIMSMVTAAMDGLEGQSVQQIVAHWTDDVLNSAGGSSSSIGEHNLAVSAAVIKGVIAKANDTTFLNEHIVPRFRDSFLEINSYEQVLIGKAPIGYIADALMATRPENWEATHREAVYNHLKKNYEQVYQSETMAGGSGLVTSAFAVNFRELARACRPPSER